LTYGVHASAIIIASADVIALSRENCLAGLKILDLTQFEAGPSCTEALAWLGADVVKVENPGSGDPGRSDADALYFLQYNSNKRSAAINLKDPRGLELVKRLAKCADVMIENFAPGAIERRGLGYEVINAANPANLLPGYRVRHRRPVREEPRLRYDRAS
jgi:formyl-CoA transferase